MASKDGSGASDDIATRLVTLGRDRDVTGVFVNPPVVHASTVLFGNADDLVANRQHYTYGRRGTPTSEALESAITALEGAAGTVLCPSGLNAASTALLSVLRAGDHLLMTDTAYGPTRHVAEGLLTRIGVETTFYDPAIGAGIAALFRPNTRAVYTEVPGSLTFEMQDLDAIAAAAHAHEGQDIFVLCDNTWATPAFFRPIEHGADLSILAATKYVVGHSDAMMGTVSASPRAWRDLKKTHGDLGLCAGPDDIYLTLRGLRTMKVRLDRQMASAITIADWLADRPEVKRVLHPALGTDPGHALWKRQMTGASGLFAFVPDGWNIERVKRFIDGLRLFGRGYSWGGFESLVIVADPAKLRTATPWPHGLILRLHIGLEDPGDLIGDLEAAFAASAQD